MITGHGYGFASSVFEFLSTDIHSIVGYLSSREAQRMSGAIESKQISVWNETIGWLKVALHNCIDSLPSSSLWSLCLEYEIPRRGGRIDAILLADDLIILIEFKKSKADLASQRQVEDYGLELIDFHAGSKNRKVIPIVCAGSSAKITCKLHKNNSMVNHVSTTNPQELSIAINTLYNQNHDVSASTIILEEWLNSSYEPTPTIIEAAKALYAGNTVGDISNSQASAIHLERTEKAVASIIDESILSNYKAICFITGVPGAGKTLAGLNIVHSLKEKITSTFLSGNGPLVKVLQAALTEDFIKRKGAKKSEARHKATTSVTNIHKWIDEYIDRSPNTIPHEKVIVFDEAQRAWNKEQSERKFGRNFSEPEMILSAMDRHKDWCVVVALIGGGQEINTGEAGLPEWGRALANIFPHWKISISPALLTGDSSTEDASNIASSRITQNENLHLSVSQRSYRGSQLTEFVESVLLGDAAKAKNILSLIPDYPILLTRDINKAKSWLLDNSRGLRRCGFVASSGARRLRVHGLDVATLIEVEDWFLKPHSDVRSSNYLEIPATEYKIQGLELDWVGLGWGGDLIRSPKGWIFKQFRGTKWDAVNSLEKQKYLINKYRVLLTRAREGLIIWIPHGDNNDATRNPSIYDPTYNYLISCGIPVLE